MSLEIRSCLIGLLLALVPACVGRPVVGLVPEGEPPEEDTCVEPDLDCDLLDTAGIARSPLPPSDWLPIPPENVFAGGAPVRSEALTPSPGATFTLENTALTLELEDDETATISNIDLDRTELDVSGEGRARLILERIQAENLTLHVREGVVVEIRDSSLRWSSLTVEARAHLDVYDSVIDLSRVTGVESSINRRATARLVDSQLSRSTLTMPELDLEECSMYTSTMSTDLLFAAAFGTSEVDLYLDEALFVGAILSQSQVLGCRAMRYVSGFIRRSYLSACQEATELADTEITQSAIEGGVDLQASLAFATVFHGGEDAIALLDSGVASSLFCDSHQLHAEDTTIECVRCDPDIELVSVSGGQIDAPGCPNLQSAFEAQFSRGQ